MGEERVREKIQSEYTMYTYKQVIMKPTVMYYITKKHF